MDSQKVANWAQIIGTLMGAVLLGYTVWDHWPPASQPSVGVGWGGSVSGYMPPALIALILLASSALQLILWRRRHAQTKNVAAAIAPAATGEIQRLTGEIETLKTNLSEAQSKAHNLDKDLTGKKQQMKEVQRERDSYKEEAQSLKHQYDEEHQAAIRLKTLNEQYEKQISNLKSDAEEARKEKLAAESNLQGVVTDRNNYRRWFDELACLTPAIKEQKRDISNYVQVLAARPCLLNLKERVVIIDLLIRNDSFFDITIKGDAVSGRLLTEKKGLLHDPAKAFVDLIHRPIENLKPTKEATVALIQPLLKTEAEDIEDAIANDGGCFWLGNLNIPISVQNAEPLHIDSKPLRINSDVEHVYFREFGALTFDGEAITPRELLRDVEALPFPERARIYRELSKAYGESLWRLNKAEEKKDPEDLAQESINRNTNNA
jgi:uncharacterized protein YoxC